MKKSKVIRPDGSEVFVDHKYDVRHYIRDDIDNFYIGNGWYKFYLNLRCETYIYNKKFIGCEGGITKSSYYCELDNHYYKSKKDIETIAKFISFI